jgi:hypothetical protein
MFGLFRKKKEIIIDGLCCNVIAHEGVGLGHLYELDAFIDKSIHYDRIILNYGAFVGYKEFAMLAERNSRMVVQLQNKIEMLSRELVAAEMGKNGSDLAYEELRKKYDRLIGEMCPVDEGMKECRDYPPKPIVIKKKSNQIKK